MTNDMKIINPVSDDRQIEIFDKQRKINLQKLFTPEGMDLMIAEIRKDALCFEGDMTTKEGRKQIKSMAYRVACSKAPLEGLAKELKEDHQAIIAGINGQVTKFKKSFDELRDEIRKPIDEIEEREAAELKARQDRFNEIERLSTTRAFNSVNDVKGLLKDLEQAFDFDNWGSFEFKAKSTYEEAKKYLKSEVEKGIKHESEQKELAELRQKTAELDRKNREEEIRKNAAANAKKEAAEKQKRLKEQKAKAIADKKVAEAKAIESERLRKEHAKLAEVRAKAAAKEAEEYAKRKAAAAIKEERAAVERKRLFDEAEAAKIAANKEHCAKIERESKTFMAKIIHLEIYGSDKSESHISSYISEKIIEAVINKKIPNVSMKY
jgi:DNA repair exonuclease SbcCD ATPase subunit